jgi:ribonuclease Y
MDTIYWLGLIVAIVVFFGLGWILNSYTGKKSLNQAKAKAELLIEKATTESENLKKEKLLEAEEDNYSIKQKLEEEHKNKQISLKNLEHELNVKDSNIDRKADLIEKKEKDLNNFQRDISNKEKQLVVREEKVASLIQEHNIMLERVAGMTAQEAKEILINNLLDETKKNIARTTNKMIEDAKEDAEKKAKDIVLSAIQRAGIDMAIESTVTVINLPSDDMKGRIIGREGRNIRSFEIVTGVDVIVDDTPETIVLSAFDPLRRENAKIVMEKLVADGRIHPGRIEDMYEKTVAEMNEYLIEIGEQALLDCGVHGLHADLVQILGKLRFRSGFGQNMLQHSKEVSIFSGIIAAEISLDVNLAKRAGILHDIGRGTERYNDENHSRIGFELAKKYNENPIILNAIEAHHGAIDPTSPIAVIVQIANQISTQRPGARREVIENFISRLKSMEEIALAFDGVNNAYAIQAGKEVRVVVSHEKVDDVLLNQLATDICKKIESEVEFPGQIKVVVIREFRGIDYA